MNVSDEVMTEILTQLQKNKKWKSVIYFSKAMSLKEICYEIHDKKMLTVVYASQKWHDMLLSLQEVFFTVITDHRALEYFIIKRLLNSH